MSYQALIRPAFPAGSHIPLGWASGLAPGETFKDEPGVDGRTFRTEEQHLQRPEGKASAWTSGPDGGAGASPHPPCQCYRQQPRVQSHAPPVVAKRPWPVAPNTSDSLRRPGLWAPVGGRLPGCPLRPVPLVSDPNGGHSAEPNPPARCPRPPGMA